MSLNYLFNYRCLLLHYNLQRKQKLAGLARNVLYVALYWAVSDRGRE